MNIPEVGKIYKTFGEWDAKIISIHEKDGIFFAIHKPGTEEESFPVLHKLNGQCHPQFVVGDPPRYNKLHPADILLGQILS